MRADTASKTDEQRSARRRWRRSALVPVLAAVALVGFASAASAFHEPTVGQAVYSDGSDVQQVASGGQVTLRAYGVAPSRPTSRFVVFAGQHYYNPTPSNGLPAEIPCYSGRTALGGSAVAQNGVIPDTTVTVNLPPGTYELCFYEQPFADNPASTVTGPVLVCVGFGPCMPITTH